MEWINKLPEIDGKYIVKTQSRYGQYFTHDRVLEAIIHTNEKGQRSWTFKNQEFIAYLRQPNPILIDGKTYTPVNY